MSSSLSIASLGWLDQLSVKVNSLATGFRDDDDGVDIPKERERETRQVTEPSPVHG